MVEGHISRSNGFGDVRWGLLDLPFWKKWGGRQWRCGWQGLWQAITVG